MDKTAIIIVIIILASCGRGESSRKEKPGELKGALRNTLINSNTMIGIEKKNNQKDTLTLSSQIDRVEILCLFFGKHSDKSFRVFLSNSNLNIVSANDERDTINVGCDGKKNILIKYVNQFYIDKTNKIVNSTKDEPTPVSDYPFIRVVGQKEETPVFKKDITLRNNIEFTSEFLKFYKVLNSLIKED